MIAPSDSFSRVGDGDNEPYPNATTNACKLCNPLGACLAFRGVKGAIPFLHGSQGCATYIRRYVISHFREPMDIAASNFSESSAVFGGAGDLKSGLANVLRQYNPELIGLATTCLSETIGEDMPGHLRAFAETPAGETAPPIVSVSTASYRGTHADGFHNAVRALVETLCPASVRPFPAAPANAAVPVALMPGMSSPADLRELKRIAACFNLPLTLLPDYSETLDGPSWTDYEKLPSGGTSVDDIRNLVHARAALECGRVLAGSSATAATHLARHHGVPPYRIGLPIGLRETDRLTELLGALAGTDGLPRELAAERGRLIDSWVDGHKYVFEKRAFVYGEEDLVVGLASFLTEIGIIPVLCASGGRSGRLASALRSTLPALDERTVIREGADFSTLADEAAALKPDFLIGSSKGYGVARKLGVPLIRCGFPVHDRIGGQRILTAGYAGAQALYDRIVNTLLERKQEDSPIGYSYL